jgi:CHAT domain-containing protein/tetratricopeptide (TPR) repeat protein
MAHPITPRFVICRRFPPLAAGRLVFCLALWLALEPARPALAGAGLATLASPRHPLSAAQQTPAALEANKPIERELGGGETHAYRVTLGAGQFARVTAAQQGIDLSLSFAGPDGKPLAEVDLIGGTSGLEAACWIAEAAGDYRIEIAAAEKAAPRGRYQLLLVDLRAATDTDRHRFAAQSAYLQAEELQADRQPEARRQALAKYGEAARLWRSLGERELLPNALFNLGDLHRRLNDYPPALDHFTQSLELWRALGDREGEAAALNSLGAVYSAQGEKQKALDHFNQALPLRRQTGDRTGEAITLNAIAAVTADLGERRKAVGLHQQVLALRRETKDRRGEAVTLNNLAVAYQGLGEKRRAIEHYTQALQIWRALRETSSEANTLTNLGNTYSDLGEQQRALDAYAQALRLRRAARDARGEAVTLTSMGRAYELLGVPREALNYYQQALPVFRQAADRRWQAITLNFMGLAYWAAGEYQAALDHFNQALPLRRELKDATGEAATLNNLGLVYESLGETEKSLEVYHQALPLFRQLGDRQSEARTLNNLGFAYEARGDRQRALAHHQQALQLSREVGDRMREAKAHYGIARIERARGQLRQARSQIEQAIKQVEALRAKLASPELRASYRASAQQYYDLYIDVFMRLHRRQPGSGFAALALEANERARARSLIELLTEAGADIRQGVDAALVERERELQEQINDKTAEQIKLLGGKNMQEQVAAAAQELEKLTAELRDAQAEIRRSSPRYAALTQPEPLTVSQLQQQALDADTLLLEYALGEERSYLWAVTATSLRSFRLPPRAEIEEAARRFYEALTARNQPRANESSQRRQTRIANADAESREAAAALSRMLLAPVAAQLGNKRLLIVADGALQYVPFAALPVPAMGGRGDTATRRGGSDRRGPASPRPRLSATPLIVRHEILSLPSASTLAVLRHETAGRGTAPKTALVLADPVFESKDERVKVISLSAENQTAPAPETESQGAKSSAASPATATDAARILVTKSAKDTGAVDGALGIPRLPHTRREAKAILALVNSEAGKAAFDFAADRAAALSDELGRYRIVHFATHGFLNSLHPELSGLVLSLVDEQGAPQNGFLLAPEVYNLKLPATELVVLSACQTGWGQEVKGEGVIGLTRGFMYAGAPRVVVSLWNVSDQATADLMRHFYEQMLSQGLRPAAALRAAQVALWKQPRWQAPYYWAAFALQGEWK